MARKSLETLFLEAVSAGIHGRRTRWDSVPQELWNGLFRLAETQKLLPLVVDAVCECPNAAEDPQFSVWRGAAKRQILQQAQRDEGFWAVHRELRRAGIPVLVVKGSICRSVYPNGALRISGDADVLVEEVRFPEACRVLEEAGLRPLTDENPGEAAEIGWKSPNSPVYLELHRFLFPPDSGPFGLLQAPFSDVFSRARTYPLEGGQTLESLSPHDHLLYLLLHAMKHFIRTGFGLRQICDVGLWGARWGGEIDWELLRRQTEGVHGARFSAGVFAIADQHLGIRLELPACWSEITPDPEPMLRDLLEGGIYGSATEGRTHTARITQDAVAARRAGKRSSLRTALFPPAKSLEQAYPELKEHPARLPLVWEKRLIRYLRQAGSAPTETPAETLRLGKQRLALLREYGILETE